MANFDSGVKGYIIGRANVQNAFPVDFRGVSDVSCRQCRFYRMSSRKCGLNEALIPYPDKYIGPECPLEFEKED